MAAGLNTGYPYNYCCITCWRSSFGGGRTEYSASCITCWRSVFQCWQDRIQDTFIAVLPSGVSFGGGRSEYMIPLFLYYPLSFTQNTWYLHSCITRCRSPQSTGYLYCCITRCLVAATKHQTDRTATVFSNPELWVITALFLLCSSGTTVGLSSRGGLGGLNSLWKQQ